VAPALLEGGRRVAPALLEGGWRVAQKVLDPEGGLRVALEWLEGDRRAATRLLEGGRRVARGSCHSCRRVLPALPDSRHRMLGLIDGRVMKLHTIYKCSNRLAAVRGSGRGSDTSASA
jgi:hypothetical protein